MTSPMTFFSVSSFSLKVIVIYCMSSTLALSPLSITPTLAIKKAHTHTPTSAHTPFLGTGNMDCAPLHPYFRVVSLVSLYILSVEATWKIQLVFKHVYVPDPVTGFSLHEYMDRVGHGRHHSFQFSSSLQNIYTHTCTQTYTPMYTLQKHRVTHRYMHVLTPPYGLTKS